MPTKIVVQGVTKKQTNGDYKEYDYSVTLDDDITEEEAVSIVLKQAEGYGLYRKASQREDRIQVSYVGVQRDEPLIRIQTRDAQGRFQGYDAIGRQLWALVGKPNTQPRDALGHFVSFESYAKSRGISLATGTAMTRTRTGVADLQRGITQYFGSESWKKARSGNEWRKEGVRREKMPYKQMRFEDED